MRLFGSHLIKRGLLTEAQLVAGLDNQRRLTPTVGHIARQEGKLTVQQVYQVLNRQAHTGARFLETAVALGFIREAEIQRLLCLQRASRPPIGELLVQMGYLTAEVIAAELKRALAEAADEPQARTDSVQPIEPAA